MNTLILDVHRKKEIALFTKSKQVLGPSCVLPSKWFSQWLKYLKGGPKPSRIYLNTLLDSKCNPKPNLIQNKDYNTVSKSLFEYLKRTYGCDHQINCSPNDIYTQFLFPPSSQDFSRSISPMPSKRFSMNSLHSSKAAKIRPGRDLVSSCERFWSPRLTQASLQPVELNLKGIIGLKNQGSLCYMNSTLQCLLALNNLTRALLNLKSEAPLVSLLKSFYLDVKLGIASNQKFQEFFSQEFPNNRQHDLPEFFRYFLSTLDTELAPSIQHCSKVSCKINTNVHSELITKLFSGLLCSIVTCKRCGDVKGNYETFTSVALEISRSVERSLERFLDKEVVEAQYFCERCAEIGAIEKQICVIRSPKVLILQMKRFVNEPFVRKINMHCEFGFELWVEGWASRAGYSLRAVAVHSGAAGSGHYSAFCKRNSRWYYFDDQLVWEVEEEKVKEAQAYLLIYTKKYRKE